MSLPNRIAGGLGAVLLLMGVVICAPAAAGAQTLIDMDARAAELSREELTQLLERLEVAATAPGYSRELRSQAGREAGFVRERLEEGDFRVGDRVVLEVRGEPQLSDSFTVTSDRSLDLPQIGEVSLRGVLRSELEDHLDEELGRFLRDQQVRARALIRIAVLGSVGNPGFYTVPATALVEEVLMSAGGPAANADLNAVSVHRGQTVLWSGEMLQRAIVEGRTLDQLSLQAGDRIQIPQRRPSLFEGGIIRTLMVAVPPLVYMAIRFF